MQNAELKLLFVDDSDVDVELTLRTLKRRGFAVTWNRVETEVEMRRALEHSPPQVILSDFSMPLFEGSSALRVACEVAPEVPFVFLSGSIGDERAAQTMQMGASGYVEKGNMDQLEGLLRRLTGTA